MSCQGHTLESRRRELLELAAEIAEKFKSSPAFKGRKITVSLRIPSKEDVK